MGLYNFEFQIKTKIKFGKNKIEELNDSLKSFGAKRIMLVVDQGIIEAGLIDKIEKILKESDFDYFIFDQVKPDPTIEIVNSGVRFLLNNNIDALVAVGGGSPIDTAKAIRASFSKTELAEKITADKLPLITIPTTSGSGSEVTKAIVIKDENTKKKFAVANENLAPDISIVDPVMTKTLPPYLTAVGGMDALSHCIESYTSHDAVLPFEMIATKGIEMVKNYLRPAVGNGNNMEARAGMSLASLFGGISLSNCGLGLVHAISHPLGGQFNIPHGLANSMILPYVMEFNIIANPAKYANIARLFGVNIDNMTEMEAAYKAVKEVEKIKKDIGLDYSLDDFGVDKFEFIAELALKEKLMLKSNPRSIEKDDIIKILRRAY
ncbi:iron-containing alcohol dehydrogenase [Halanaerobium congolense]|jgi:alcohol dehydrogenase|uniref:Alcohol dehydrogenase n=1 Tax=Halanaerobium congolense TaxID=54121 RepID=A0A1G6L5K7_9FIRM|nr:iron-containing alcohol dehydrogenase [Halanaerobium congolense]PXV64778.1 alcohol dehydrogenase [Halanaerobium congolense]TDS35354.1 alcohol dehydrogenase [Halanaerobium congolense]SDC38421.1 Iron-containing alcohol dehydrogenase [Halanaerobium congolense]SDK63414.1 Iron-containing alcohol dehydrogenase [Halanaerobium congolense]SDM28288.1 Iron-containing alcohol dehydrogenase [Halanaerobium congolense]